jgi:hypothetical protein
MIARIRIRGFPLEIDMQNQHGIRWWHDIRDQLRIQAPSLYKSAVRAHAQDERPLEVPVSKQEGQFPLPGEHLENRSSSIEDSPEVTSVPVSAPAVPHELELDWSLANLDWSLGGFGQNPAPLSNSFLTGDS